MKRWVIVVVVAGLCVCEKEREREIQEYCMLEHYIWHKFTTMMRHDILIKYYLNKQGYILQELGVSSESNWTTEITTNSYTRSWRTKSFIWTAEKIRQCWGVREGNAGMDWRINFLLLLRPGEIPKSQWGGDTLLLFGEADFMPAMGDPFPWRISGSSSSWTVSKCLSSLDCGGKKCGFRSPGIAYKPDEEPIEGNAERGGFFFEEKGCWTNALCDTVERRVSNLGQ